MEITWETGNISLRNYVVILSNIPNVIICYLGLTDFAQEIADKTKGHCKLNTLLCRNKPVFNMYEPTHFI